MFIEIIEEITKAEELAREIRKKADLKANEVITEAISEAKKICSDATLSAEQEYGKKINETKKAARARIDEYRRISYENAATAAEVVRKRTEIAVSFVIDNVLNQYTEV